jgi:hypothetical protein
MRFQACGLPSADSVPSQCRLSSSVRLSTLTDGPAGGTGYPYNTRTAAHVAVGVVDPLAVCRVRAAVSHVKWVVTQKNGKQRRCVATV